MIFGIGYSIVRNIINIGNYNEIEVLALLSDSVSMLKWLRRI
jgi:hypothetical protein